MNFAIPPMGLLPALDDHCLLCEQPASTPLCHICLQDAPRLPDLTPRQGSGLQTAHITTLYAMAPYQWPWSYLVQRFKFSGCRAAGRALTFGFRQRLLEQIEPLPRGIVPVPLHPWRQARRGFNQAGVMAAELANQCGIKYYPNLVTRRRNTRPQHQLDASQRRGNLHNGFDVECPVALNHIALLDDVVTTGATINAVAAALKAQQPSLQIDVWALTLTVNSSAMGS
ncbi:hypothetical protein LJ739_12260 [Aestuariibacter halophilus]|uniref:ComF family protein n=1 Tax=Fluctibacter halophilus TaxID=226011 RepID=A0ABS8G8W3_9ALTE|nr:hypothetical protein [Aestuariibacter halophilus]MCC2617017.1 hypothetical protein [Aestuariibacter halophilus]